jgi:hypothetical protein
MVDVALKRACCGAALSFVNDKKRLIALGFSIAHGDR